MHIRAKTKPWGRRNCLQSSETGLHRGTDLRKATHYPSMHRLHTETEDDVSLTLLPLEWGTCGWGWGSSGPSSQSGISPPTPPSPDQAESTSQWRTQEHPYSHLETYVDFNTNTQKHDWIIPDTHVWKICFFKWFLYSLTLLLNLWHRETCGWSQ